MTLELLNIIRNETVPLLAGVILKTNYEGMGKKDKAEFERDFREILDLAEKALKEQEKRRWIPVSERLPEIQEFTCDGEKYGYSEKVLVCFENVSGIEICEYRFEDGNYKWFVGELDESPEDVGARISAWMPLPEPYKAKATGHWIDVGAGMSMFPNKCSKCGERQGSRSKYCPECGAKME